MGGLRFDYHSIYGSQLNGRLGLVSSPLSSVHVKLLYGGSFKAPAPLLLYAVPMEPGDILGNAQLKPQRADTFEGQIAWTASPGLVMSTGVSYLLVQNMAAFQEQGLNEVAVNIAKMTSLTWETRLDASYKWILGYGSFELVRARRDTGMVGYVGELLGTRAPIYPWAQVHLGVAILPASLPVRIGLQGTWVASRNASDSNALDAGGVYSLPSYVQLDGNIALTRIRLFGDDRRTGTLSLVARNILDTQVADPGFAGVDYPRPPRTIILSYAQEL